MNPIRVLLSLLLLASAEHAVMPTLEAANPTGEEIAFVERFALAKDRATALEELIPGTEDYYYWHALHHQQTGDAEQFAQVIDQWAKRHRASDARERLLDRQAFIDYEKNPEESLERIRRQLGLKFDHSRENKSSKPDFPTGLDQGLVAWQAFLVDARRRSGTLKYVHGSGFDRLLADKGLAKKLEDAELRDLLSRLDRPDHATLVPLLARELKMKESGGFGSLDIHWKLTTVQLDALEKLRADLTHNDNFVQARLRRLLPDADKNLERQPAVRGTYYAAAWEYVSDLPPSFNSLRAHFLFLLLDHHRKVEGEYPKDLFLTYLELPRNGRVTNPEYLEENPDLRRWAADLNASFPRGCVTPPVTVSRDEELIRSYLMEYFLHEDGYEPYKPYLRESWLKPLFAEVKIVNGLDEQEKWASLIHPGQYQQLRERVDIEFAEGNPEQFEIDDKVELTVDLKNVEKLIVKVYEINALGYYLSEGKEVGTDLQLDGLVANEEKTYEYKQAALLRHREKFTFPEIDGRRGIWIVEFIGNSRSSRALIRKGQLSHVARPSGAGTALWVLDEAGKVLPKAALWTQGRKYLASDKKGRAGMILLPFGNGGSQSVTLADGPDDGAFATLSSCDVPAENYGFNAKFHVEREDLLRRNKAQVVVRSQLTAGGMPTSFKLIEDCSLHLTVTDLDGVASTEVIPNFQLYPDRESVHEFTVPERLGSMQFRLELRVKGLDGATRNLKASSRGVVVNQIDRGEQVKDLQLSRNEAGGFFLEVLGKNAEPIVDQAVTCHFVHPDFKSIIVRSLKSDDKGRVHLGALVGIHSLVASGPGIVEKQFALPVSRNSYPSSLHGVVGRELRVPYAGRLEKPSRGEVSLLEIRGGAFAMDHFDKVSIEKGFLVLKDLGPGDYSLQLKDPVRQQIKVRITELGHEIGNVALGEVRSLELLHQKPLQIVSVEANRRSLAVQLANATPLSRVHVIATRYEPRFRVEDDLGGITGLEPLVGSPAHRPSLYLSGRKIGDEYRYVIDRRYATKFPGVMAPRPGLLLNPWAVRETEPGSQQASDGEDWKREKPGAASDSSRGQKMKREAVSPPLAFGNLDYLRSGSVELLNLVADEKGVVRIPRNDLGDRHLIHVVATDPESLVYRTITLPEPDEIEFRDLRLLTGFDPAKKYTQQKQVTVMAAGRKLQVKDLLSSRFAAYDSLSAIYGLFRGLNADPKLEQFAFLLKWPALEDAEKRRLYSRHACHELSFFLSLRDPDFFKEVVAPHLEHKKDKTFLDDYLLARDLVGYLEPWNYSQLNVVERALLARRIDGAQPRTARHLRDLLSVLPAEQRPVALYFFESALQSQALGGADRFGFDGAKDQRISEVAAQVALGEQMKKSSGGVGGGADALMDDAFAPAPSSAPVPASERARGLERDLRASGLTEEAGELREKMDRLERLSESDEGLAVAGKIVRPRSVPAEAASSRFSRSGRELVENESMLGMDVSAIDGGYLMDGLISDLRDEVRDHYRKLGKSKEWAENNYDRLRITEQGAGLVGVDRFWRDFAAWDGMGIFLSEHVGEASGNFTEMMFALSVIGLPFEAAEHQSSIGEDGFTLEAAGPMLVFHEEIREAQDAEEQGTLLVGQHFFRKGDRYLEKDGDRIEKYVTEEFLRGAVYGSQVVVTNPTARSRKLDVLSQIPHGAIPVMGSRPTQTLSVEIAPYATQPIEFHFYFPSVGKHAHYPVHVAADEAVVGAAEPFVFNVVDELSIKDTASWDYLSQWGTEAEVFGFLEQNNVEQIELAKVAWRCRENGDFFKKLTQVLEQRHHYDSVIYSYALLHNVKEPLQQMLRHQDGILDRVGPALDSPLIDIDPVIRKRYEHLEYAPLVNARAHVLGGVRKILNPQQRQQYHALMNVLAHRSALDDVDRMAVAYHLLLQDRHEEGLAFLDAVDAANLETTLQYDYMTAIAALLREKPAEARGIADRYVDYPVDRWKTRFDVVRAHLDEAAGAEQGDAAAKADPDAKDGEAREGRQELLADSEPTFELELGEGEFFIDSTNLEEVVANFYLMDLEFLFSSNPFVGSGGSSRFSVIKPNQTMKVKLDPKSKEKKTVQLPGELRQANVLVEVVGAGRRESVAAYANQLKVDVVENYGRLQVSHAETGKPIAKAYVKVYAKTPGGAVFYKDGYTDLRGKFDYASLNTDDLAGVERFAILVMSEKEGAVVREVDAPAVIK